MTTHPGRNRPLYVAFEGQEGCGKSTQSRLLADSLDAVLTREPGGTELGADLRRMLLHTPNPVDPRAEALLFAADRAQHFAEVIEPALNAGRHVVSDRSLWSSVVYQGIGRSLGPAQILATSQWATRNVVPDVVVLLDADTNLLRERLVSRSLDRIEAESLSFFETVRDGFLALAHAHNWLVVDAALPAETIASSIAAQLGERMHAHHMAQAVAR